MLAAINLYVTILLPVYVNIFPKNNSILKIIQMSNSVLNKAGHTLLHGKRDVFLEDDAQKDEKEQENVS